jgi:hemoglobin/transferrin/lactoferrin receptor protein
VLCDAGVSANGPMAKNFHYYFIMRKIFIYTIAGILTALQVTAQSDTSVVATEQEEATVTALRFPEQLSKIPFAVKKIVNKGWNMNSPNMGDVLQNSGAVFVQKSQGGGGSPVLRGFEASRVLLMVDGVRMNNAIFRAGHLQNVITVDANVLQFADVLYGPSSTMYGSDALGGVVNMFTLKPVLSNAAGKTNVSGNIGGRYSSAMNEFQLHADINIATNKWASLTSITGSDFGDIRQGDKRKAAYPNFGSKPFYVNTVSGNDFRVVNPDSNKQIASGYKQIDLMQKILYVPKAGREHVLNVQYSNSTDIPRYDRLTEVAGANPRFGEWYYGPQQRFLAAYQFNGTYQNRYFEKVQSVLSYQDVEESRFDRRFNNKVRNNRFEKIKVWGYTLDALHKKGPHEGHMGLDIQLNDLRSVAYGENIVTGVRSAINTRYADGDNNMNIWAVYYQHLYKIHNRLTLSGGARYTRAALRSTFVDRTIMKFPFTEAEQKKGAFSGNLGLTYSAPGNWRLAGLISTGFRAPNFDDLGKVFDSRAGSVVVPNPELKPEYTYNGEINVNKWGANASFGASMFYTLFRNAIVVDKFTFNNQPTIVYQGVNSTVLASQNKNKAYLYGASANFRFTVGGNTDIEGTATYTYARVKTDSVDVPLDHIPPMYGRFGVKHRQAKWNAELFGLFNGQKKIKDYSNSGEDNQQYATVDGMPSWMTLNLRTQFFIHPKISVLAGVENMLDTNYRLFASGISMPGRNFILSLRAGF